VLELPKLKVRSKADAINLLGEQIKRGRQIDVLKQGHELAQTRFAEWDVETSELLLAMFEVDKFAREYDQITEGTYLTGTPGTVNWTMSFLGRLEDKIKYVKELQRRIDSHFSEPQNQVQPPHAFWDMIHPEIVSVAKSRFDSGHYADCAEAAFKHLNGIVKSEFKRTREAMNAMAPH
jgi:hypothetical protein